MNHTYTFQNYCDENGLQYSNAFGLWFIEITGKNDSTIDFLDKNISVFNYKLNYHGFRVFVSMSDVSFTTNLFIKNTFLDVNVEGTVFRLVIDKRWKNAAIEYIKKLRNFCPLNASKIGKWDAQFNCVHDGKLHLKESKIIIEYAKETQDIQYTDLPEGLYLL
jgi:hypothetical protein